MLEKQHKYLNDQVMIPVVALDYKIKVMFSNRKRMIFTKKLILFEVVLDPNEDKKLFD